MHLCLQEMHYVKEILDEKCADPERGIENGLYNVTCDNGREIAVTVTGVVGQNGDGKSGADENFRWSLMHA